MTRGFPVGEGIRPPRRICATATGRQPQDRRRHIGLTITEGRMTLLRLQDLQAVTALILTLIMKSRTGQSLTILTNRDVMFRPLRLTEDIGNEQRGFLKFQR